MAPASSSTNGKSHAAIEAERAKSLFCFREDIAPGLRLEMELKKIFVSTQSEFQQVEVVETYFGKVRRENEKERTSAKE
jgi:spermidine synthase